MQEILQFYHASKMSIISHFRKTVQKSMSVHIAGNSLSTCVKINKKRAFHYRCITQQVLGITPYASHPKLPTRELAKAIIRSMRGPSDYQIEHKYTRNLALLVSSHIHPHTGTLYPCTLHLHVLCMRKFVRESSSATQRGELHKLYKNWLSSTYPPEGVLTDSQWEDVMAEDASVR